MSSAKDSDPRDSTLEAPYSLPSTWYMVNSGLFSLSSLQRDAKYPRWSWYIWHVSIRPHYGYSQQVRCALSALHTWSHISRKQTHCLARITVRHQSTHQHTSTSKQRRWERRVEFPVSRVFQKPMAVFDGFCKFRKVMCDCFNCGLYPNVPHYQNVVMYY